MAVRLKSIAPVAVASAGTAVQLSSTDILFVKAIFQAKAGNTGTLFLGDSDVKASTARGIALAAGASITIDADEHGAISLKEMFADATVNGDSVSIVYLEKV